MALAREGSVRAVKVPRPDAVGRSFPSLAITRPFSVRDASVRRLVAAEAVAFVQRWHYSGTASPGVARYGWFWGGELVGVSIFDTGNHAMRCGVLGEEHYRRVLHHHRLTVSDAVPHGVTSSFLAASLRALRRDRPETLAVVTYADTDQGHVGTVYQATNAVFTGTVSTGNLYLRRDDGTLSTMQGLKHLGTWSERRAVARERGWEEVRSGGRHRYVYLFGKARRGKPALRWAVLPYPKIARSMVECGQAG